MNNWLRYQPPNLKQITGVIDIKLLCTEVIANIVREVCTPGPNNDLTPVCVLRSARYHFSRLGGSARGREERKKGKVPCMLALGSCFPLGWTCKMWGGETGMVHSLNTGARELTQGGKQAAFLFVPGHAVHTWTSFPREDVYPAS